jgi:hypothetical protein
MAAEFRRRLIFSRRNRRDFLAFSDCSEDNSTGLKKDK